MDVLTPTELITLRRQAQQLAAPQLTEAAQVAAQACGLQAQDVEAGLLAVRVRSRQLTAAGVRAAWQIESKLVRTWCMRGTLHLVARDDVRWMLPLFGPLFIRKSQRRYKQLGLSEDVRRRAADIIGQQLAAQDVLTRAELAQHLDQAGIPTQGQAIIHLIRYAALRGMVCYGPDRDGQETFTLLDVETSDADEAALWAKLVRRYLAAYGPAQPADMASWSGLSVRRARRAFEDAGDTLAAVQVGDQTYWQLKAREPAASPPDPCVRLLPGYDNFLLGYQSRALILDEAYAKRVHPGGGYLYPTVLVNTRLAGTWQTRQRQAQLVVQVEPFEPFSSSVVTALEAEVVDVGRFLGQDAVLELEG